MVENVNSKKYDVIIMGAGAAGLMAALSASQRDRKVLLDEKRNMPGKEGLMSGGGKCNFTNLSVTPENFVSQNPRFSASALSRYIPEDFVRLVESHHINYEERKHGQLFCVGSSREILDMLLVECKAGGIEILTHFDTHEVNRASADYETNKVKNDFIVRGRIQGNKNTNVEYSCESLIVATGGLSIPTLGGSSFGYRLAEDFDIGHIPTSAGLVPFVLTGELQGALENLAGVSMDAEIKCDGQMFRESLLFTHKGLSGPVVLQISNYWNKHNPIFINLLPDDDFDSQFKSWLADFPDSLLRSCLRRSLPRSFVSYIENEWWSEYKTTPMRKIPIHKVQELTSMFRAWEIKPSGTEGYKTAEVTLGGVDTNSISSKTFESRNHPGLYFIGEVLDVTGQLGGFNFHWAWASGHAAGSYA